jgi:hypothetical protein
MSARAVCTPGIAPFSACLMLPSAVCTLPRRPSYESGSTIYTPQF